MTAHQEEKRADSALQALRAYKNDLDQAIAAFSMYAATHEKRVQFEMPRLERKLAGKRILMQ